MANVNGEVRCIVCDAPNARFCDRCKSTRYCSKECQRADWTTHKLLCPAFLKFDVTKRPSDEHFRAISFPVDKEKPELIWIHCPWHADEDDEDYGLRYQFPDSDKRKLLGEDAFARSMTIQKNKILGRVLSDTIHLCHRDGFLIDGSSDNKSIAPITATKPWQCHNWKGPIFAYGTEGLGIDQTTCRDLDMNDFRHVVDYLLVYNSRPAIATGKPVSGGIRGVLINCLGDQKMCNRPHFEAIDISPADPIFEIYSNRDVSDIAKRIELPIFTRRCEPHPKWANDEDNKLFKHESPYNNQDATFLHLCLDPKAEFNPQEGIMGWGWAPMQWQNHVGSAIVVRQDKKPLHPLHAEALSYYCRYRARSFIAHSMGEYAPEQPMDKEAVLSMICRPAFIISWYDMLEEKRKRGEDTADSPYPYTDVEI
ncbi:hypothetical protein F5Y11DRAFT_309862 [Daldinia sp. FL1419]|nr:hypothetical protein F5Y11DRAFT_309862 [Daldinia sp. FL1419]